MHAMIKSLIICCLLKDYCLPIFVSHYQIILFTDLCFFENVRVNFRFASLRQCNKKKKNCQPSLRFAKNHSPHRVYFYMLHMWIRNEVSLCVERHTMESADISIPLFDHNNRKCTFHCCASNNGMLTSAYHCLTHNNGNVNHSPHRNVNHSPHRVCFYVLHMWIKNEVSLCVESVLEHSLYHSPHRVCFYVVHVWIRNEVSLCVESVLKY